MKHPNEAFIDLNIRSKLLNLSELARRLETRPTTLYNRINNIGSHKPLSTTELLNIEDIIRQDLFGDNEKIPLENIEFDD